MTPWRLAKPQEKRSPHPQHGWAAKRCRLRLAAPSPVGGVASAAAVDPGHATRTSTATSKMIHVRFTQTRLTGRRGTATASHQAAGGQLPEYLRREAPNLHNRRPAFALSQGRGKMMSATQRGCSQVATPRPLGGPRLGSMVALRVEFRWRRWRGSPAWCAQLLRVLIAQRPGAAREKTRSGVSERTSMRNRTRVAASTTTERRLRCCHTWDRF